MRNTQATDQAEVTGRRAFGRQARRRPIGTMSEEDAIRLVMSGYNIDGKYYVDRHGAMCKVSTLAISLDCTGEDEN